MLWPHLLEYAEPVSHHLSQHQPQGNLALFLTLFILTVVEVLIIKVSQTDVTLLLPHDPPYGQESEDDDIYDDDDEDDDADNGHTNDREIMTRW